MAGALLAAAASDAPVNDRVTALDAFLGELRTDKALLLGDPTLWAGVLALASPGPSHPPEVAAAALRVAEEVVCRVQGLGDLRWTAMEDTARVVASCLARPGAGLIMIRQAIQFATSAYPPTFARVATTSEASPGLWALLEQIRNAVEALAGSSDDAGTLLAIARWVTAIVQTESWAMRDSRDAVVSGELPVGEACLELVGPNAVPVMLPPDALALRSTKLLEQLIGRLPLGDRAAVVSGTINSLLLLVRARPQFANMILLGIVDYWTAEEEAFSRTRSRWTAQQYRALERTVRNSLLGVFRYVTGLTLPHPAADLLLEKLNVRASELPQPYYLRLREIRAAERANLKRVEPPLESNNLPAKRPRTDLATLSARDTDGGLYLGQLPGLPTGPTSVVQNVLSLLQFDVSQIPVQTVIEMIIQVMRSCPDSAFQQAVIFARQIPSLLQQHIASSSLDSVTGAAVPQTIDPRLRDPRRLRGESPPPAERQLEMDEDLDEEDEEAVQAGSGPAPAQLLEPGEFDAAHLAELRTDILHKMLSAETVLSGRFKGAKGGWEALVGRLVAHASDEQGAEEMDAVVDYAAADFRARAELAVSYLYQLWFQEFQQADGPKDRSRYYLCLHKLLDKMSSKIDPRDRNFTKFLLDAPALDETCVDDFVARRFVEDRDRMQLGVTTLRDMVNLRPAMREKCMALLLGFCLHPDKATRQFSIQTCRRWVPDNVALASEVMKAASDAFHSITALQPEEADSETMEDDLWGIDTPYSGLPEVTCLVEFYFALCSKDHELLREIFRIYVTVSTAVQQAIRHDIHPLVRNIGMHSPILLGLLREYPDGSEGLALKCVWDLLDRGTKPTKELIGTWRNAYLERNMGPRCIIPILPHLEKQETLSYLPTVFGLLPTENSDRSKEYSVLKDLIVRLCSPASEGEKPLISPAEIMIAIHNMEESIGLKRMVCLTQLCFNMPDLFKSEQLAIVLQQLVDQPKLPTIMMRTVLQCISLHKPMTGFLQGILTRLINKRIWQNRQLWEGFIRACKMTQPQSSQVVLQLPRPQMEEILAKDGALRNGVAGYIEQLPPSQRNTPRMQGILALTRGPQ